ncbi:MAG: hypothetical protein VYA54_06325 [Bdellovibrionota bacterium]|nr:hypothetical protein [Bdellovibrionota bacterium]
MIVNKIFHFNLKSTRASLLKFSLVFLIHNTPIAQARAIAGDFIIAVGQQRMNEKIDKDTVMRAFLGEMTKWPDNSRLLPAHPKSNSLTFKEFSDQVLETSTSEYLVTWRRKLFSGRGLPPKELSSDSELLDFLKKNSDAMILLKERPKNTDGLFLVEISVK